MGRRIAVAGVALAAMLAVASVGRGAAALHGRVWVNTNPTPGATVVVEDLQTGRIVAMTQTTGAGRGPELGAFRISGLPAGRKLVVTAKYRDYTSIAVRVKLRAGRDRRLHLFILAAPPRR